MIVIQVLCGAAIGFTLVTLVGLLWLTRRRQGDLPATWPALLVLRPCEGSEPQLLTNLLSTVKAPYPGARRILILVPSAQDPAFAVAQQAAQQAPGALEVLVTAIPDGGNRKVAQLVAGLAHARGDEELILQADSDVCFAGEEMLDLATTLLRDPDAGVAFAAPIEEGATTWPDRAAAAIVGESQQSFLALYAVTVLTGGVASLAGALCLHRRSALEKSVQGFAALEGILGEDYEVARRLHKAGFHVLLSRLPARCQDRGRHLREVVGRVGRWLLVVRAQRPGLLLTYPFFVAATPLHLTLAVALGDPLHRRMALGLWLLRELLGQVLRRLQGLPLGWPRALLAEGLLWLGFIRALLSKHVRWRGHRYLVGSGGRLLPPAHPQAAGPGRGPR